MANPEHVKIVKHGNDAIAKWLGDNPGGRLDLSEANLRKAHLIDATLSGADLSEAKLSGAVLRGAVLIEANLCEADLRWADLKRADLSRADLFDANMLDADLGSADLYAANLSRANLSKAHLYQANLSESALIQANLSDARLTGTILSAPRLNEAKFENAKCVATFWSAVDLSSCVGLETIEHSGPSTVGVDTLSWSKGRIPEAFLRGCGFSPWQVKLARLFDPELSPNEISELLSTELFMSRTEEMEYPGVFISYSHADSKFVDKLYGSLYGQGLSVWLDRHDMVAGEVEKQVLGALRERDIALVVLSENSLKSQWVWLEIRKALEKEAAEDRAILCPVALDDSWQAYEKKQVVMQQVKEKNILNFSKWKTKQFQTQFNKLLKGMRVNYTTRTAGG